jgi:hypothetical protein
MTAEATTPESSDSPTTTASSTPTPSAPPKPWSGLGYEQVPGLANRIISRYLRGQRKNMERFFQERGMLESAERCRQIRLSRQGMIAKNQMFREVLDAYARQVLSPGASTETISETAHLETIPDTDVGVQATDGGRLEGHGDGVGAGGVRPDAGGGISEVASASVDEPVIAE